MAVTSSTTAVAFFANYFSPIIPIKAFGIFAGVVVPINYFLVVMIFPAAVAFYEEHLKLKCTCWGNACTEETGDLSRVEYFFDTILNDCVRKGRFIIIVLSLIWFGVAGYFTS